MAQTNELLVRVVTGIALAAVFGAALYMGGWLFYGLVIIAGIQGFIEFKNMNPKYGILILPLVISAIWLRSENVDILVYLIAVVIATDVGAYFVGKKFGKKKLAPTISPNKTIEGACGGVFAAMVVSWLLVAPLSWGLMFSILAMVGDLLESALKRKHGLKDSGSILPGHGGILDRVDGFLLTIPVAAILVYLEILQ